MKNKIPSFILSLFILGCFIPFCLQSQSGNEAGLDDEITAVLSIQDLITLAEKSYKNNPDSSLYYAGRACDMAERNRDDLSISEAYHMMGKSWQKKLKYDTAIVYYKKSIQVLNDLKENEKLAQFIEQLTSCLKRNGNYREAIPYLEQALELSRKEGNRLDESKNLSEIGYNYYVLSEYDRASEYLNMALRISEDIGETEYTSSILNRIGLLNNRLGDNKTALEYFQKSLEIRRDLNLEDKIAGSLSNIGGVYITMEKYTEALSYFEEALEINTQLGNHSWKAINLNNMGLVYMHMEEYNKALNHMQQALAIKRARKDRRGMIFSSAYIGMVYEKTKKFDLAIEYFTLCADLSKEIGAMDQLSACYEDLFRVYKEKGNYKLALDYHEKFFTMADSIFGEEKLKIITEIQTRYETDKKAKENELLKKDAEIKHSVQNVLIILGSALLLLSILLLILFRITRKSLYKNRALHEQEIKVNELELKNKEIERLRLEELVFAEQEINRLQKEKIENKNRELSAITMQILNKNQALSDIRDMVKDMKGGASEENNNCGSILSKIDHSDQFDQDWDQFKKHFEEVHPRFFKSLSGKFPLLTSNDLKLCAYIRINLNNKEIARMLNVTPDTVKKARQRLKKKMELGQEEDIGEFLLSV
nr:tetratricopeptide repeat protein [Bacteroidota bacterium]